VLSFVKGDERRIVAWTTSSGPRRVAIPQVSGQFSITTMNSSNGGRVQVIQGTLTIDLSSTPVYLVAVN